MHFTRSIIAALALVSCGSVVSLAQVFEGTTLVKASLAPSVNAVVPGKPFQIALVLEMAPGWHTYWEYSGDAGLPTRIEWELPRGFVAGPIEWPVPEAKLEPGDIQTYGYAGDVALLVTIVAPADLPPGSDVVLRAKASWLVCKEICVPGSASLEVTLPVAPVSAAVDGARFTAWRKAIPSADAPPFLVRWDRSGNQVTIGAEGLPAGAKWQFFPLGSDDASVGHPISVPGGVRVESSAPLRGVIALEGGGSWSVAESGLPATAPASIGVWTALFYGFLGGLILNLMPCVLPVISLKIFGFIRQAGDDPRKILLHGLAFVAGIFVWFLALGVLIVALKSGGTEVTWAFQFQNPWFNVVIGALVFAFALNLFGVFEFVLPGRAATALEEAGSGGGAGASFFQGVFATLLATPCTAPFLGTALGVAFSQPPVFILAMFASVATGMALPYLVLSARPGWMKFLPRPGAWMERLKQFMGFPLLATLVWILSILGGQKGLDGVIWFAAFLVCVGLASWIYGAFCGPFAKVRVRLVALLLAAGILAGGGWYFLGEKFQRAGQADASAIPWVPFSEAELARLRSEGRPVFVDFTADWCLTCKVNERTAIETPAVRELLRRKNVVPMRADWTNANPEITAALKRFGRVGVPFYVIYPGEGEPVVLPELLTTGILVSALERLP